jgi:hypothetical protein
MSDTDTETGNIEITPEMIEAGTRTLWETSLVEFPNPSDREYVKAILEAALLARADRR